MSKDLFPLEGERAYLAAMVRRFDRSRRILMYAAIVIVSVVTVVLLAAIAAGQLSATALLWEGALVLGIFYLLSRGYRSDGKVVTGFDLLFAPWGWHYDPNAIRSRLRECEQRIADLKSGTCSDDPNRG